MCFTFIRIKMVEIISKYTHEAWHLFFKTILGKERKQNIFRRLWSEYSNKNRHYVGSHFQVFFILYIKQVFGVFLPAENEAVGCLCLLCLAPWKSKCWLWHTWLCRPPFLHRNKGLPGLPAMHMETQEVNQIWRQFHFLELLAPEWSYLSMYQ